MHEVFLRRCLQLAVRAGGNTHPNPLVGSVIVHDGRIVAEGWHERFGGPHAEVQALASVPDSVRLSECTLYVNLEPCCHYGKTPPCTLKILQAGIGRVVVGAQDPTPEVGGRGLQQLHAAGCEIVSGVLAAECRELNRRFYTFHEKKRPYIILKWAASADGYLGRKGERTAISGAAAQVLVHRWRSEEAAVLVGTNTALIDDPQLTVRLWPGRQPLRIVPDRRGRLHAALRLFDGSAPTLLLTEAGRHPSLAAEVQQLDFSDFGRSLLQLLWQKRVVSLLVEGGAQMLQYFITHNLWDEARVFISPKVLGDGVAAPRLHIAPLAGTDCYPDQLYFYRNAS